VMPTGIARSSAPAGDPRHPRRPLHVLSEAERGGSTCMPDAALRSELRRLLGAEVRRDAIDELSRRAPLRAGE